jgi:DNA adenine methylase
LPYPGGKCGAGVYQTIINQIPPHEVYIEPFLGAGAIMRKKAAAIRSFGVDSDHIVLSRFPKDSIRGLTLICDDALHFLTTYHWTGREFVYLDPPYLLETRSSKKRIYHNEFSDQAQHLELISIIKAIKAAVMISGYPSDLYFSELSQWRSISYRSIKRSSRKAIEYLWMNYPEPITLHDYRYIGSNFRERERIKRRQHRWRSRLERMNPLERAALLMAMEDLRTATPNLTFGTLTDPIVKNDGYGPSNNNFSKGTALKSEAKYLNHGKGITID